MDSIPFIVSPFCSLSYPLDTPLIPFRCGQLAANQTVVLAFCLRTISSPRRETRDLSTWEQPAGYGMAGLQGLIGTGQFPWTFMPWKYLSIYPWIHDHHPGFDFWSFPPLVFLHQRRKVTPEKVKSFPHGLRPARPLLPQFSFGRCRKSRRGPSLSFAPRGPCAMRSWLVLCFLLPVEGDFNSWWLSRLRMVSWLIHGIIFPQMHIGAKKKRPRNVRGLI